MSPPKLLSEISGMPQMEAAFTGWFSNITLVRITQKIVDGLVVQEEQQLTFKGTIQPLSPEEIALKPDGQRSWEWLQIHCITGSTNLVTDDRFLYGTTPYKIMAIKDYSLNNYIEYHAVRDYTDGVQ